jgi:hypothetical protein
MVSLGVTWVMVFVSLGVVGANLNYTLYLNLGYEPSGNYLHAQGAIIAFDVMLLAAIPAIFYTTFHAQKIQNLFTGVLYECIVMARWVSCLVFLTDTDTAKNIAKFYNQFITNKAQCKTTENLAAICAIYSSYESANAEEIASAVLFALFAFLPMPLSFIINNAVHLDADV